MMVKQFKAFRQIAYFNLWLSVFVFAILISNTLADTPDPLEIFESANQLYETERFSEAQELYQQLISHGVWDARVFYNLGNTYFKQGDLGQAILNYRLAQRLAPRDPDIRDNLLFAQSQIQDPIDFTDETILSRLTRFAQEWLSLNEMATATLFFWFSTTLVFIAYTYVYKQQNWLALLTQAALVLSALLLLGGIFSLSGRLYIENIRPQGIILFDEVDVSSGPGEQYVVEFSLHSGAEVSVLEERNDWTRLSLPGDQLQGWVPSQALGLVHSE